MQIDKIDDDLRNGLWQSCLEFPLNQHDRSYEGDPIFQYIVYELHVNFFKTTSDDIKKQYDLTMEDLKHWFFSVNWWRLYNFLEFLLPMQSKDFQDRITYFLEREKSGFRILSNQFVKIPDDTEISSTEESLTISDFFTGAREHVKSAI